MKKHDVDKVQKALNDFKGKVESSSKFDAGTIAENLLSPLLINDGFDIYMEGTAGNYLGTHLRAKKRLDTDKHSYIGVDFHQASSVEKIEYNDLKPINIDVEMNQSGQNLDKVIVLSNGAYSQNCRESIEREFGPSVELIDTSFVQAWVTRIQKQIIDGIQGVTDVVVQFSKLLAIEVAKNKEALNGLEWRDMEKMIGYIFSELGFDVEVTPGSNDGGKDLILSCKIKGESKSYYVEIKHWKSASKVNQSYVKDFIKVVARDQQDGGLFLSSYGFCDNIVESMSEIERSSVVLAGESKVHALCKTYVKSNSGIWSPPAILPDLIFID